MTKKENKSNMPQAEDNGFIPTFNQMGYMTSQLDQFSLDFCHHAAKIAPQKALEIGAAYGVASLKAISMGAHMLVNDLDLRHLEVIKDQLNDVESSRVKFMAGSFPEDLDIESNSLGAILICRVLHFLTPKELEFAFEKMTSWLTTGGKLFVIGETPYLKNFQSFIPIYKKRCAEGESYPGFIQDVMQVDPVRGANLPKQMHFLDKELLQDLCQKNGLAVEKCEYIERPYFPEDLKLDGRESVGLIAIKK
jgi:ubiquinone/menaquinone biosynthesis C-methylase UbiE